MIIDEKDYSNEIKELNSFIDSLPTKKGKLISVLHKAQNLIGYIPSKVQIHVAQKLDIPVSEVYGVITFYSFFNMDKKGDFRVSVCMGTACFVRGATDILDELKKELGIDVNETTSDGLFSLESLRCVGACGLAPVLSVNGKVYGRVEKENVKHILEEYMAKDGEKNE